MSKEMLEHLIDCDAAPFVSSNLTLAPESDQLPKRVRGIFKWDSTQVKLYLAKAQQDGIIKGCELKNKLLDKPVLPAQVLDYLLAHPHLIPEECKGKAVFFWGTVYRGAYGDLCVRHLYWYGGRWIWYCRWLGFDWGSYDPAALRAS